MPMANPSDPLTTPRSPLGNGHDPAGGNGMGERTRPGLAGPVPGRGRPPGPTVKPAAAVFGIIALLFVVGFVTDDLTSAHHPTAPPATSAAGTAGTVPGTGGLVAEKARAVIGPVVRSEEPPTDVLAALVVPKGTVAVPGTATQRGVGLYDATIDLQVPAPELDAITFFRTELKAALWSLTSTGPSGTGYQVLAQHPGSDGYEWEVGFTISPTRFTSAVAGQGVPPTGVTPVTLRLYANSYDS